VALDYGLCVASDGKEKGAKQETGEYAA